MSPTRKVFAGGQVFDGQRLRDDCVAVFAAGQLVSLQDHVGACDEVIQLEGDIICPGFVDLQVNGGGGLMFNQHPTAETLEVIARAHRQSGTMAILPTLITDTPDKSQAAIAAVIEAISVGVRGIAGLHLEGPHLSVTRKGAHDAALIRPMDDTDMAMLLGAVDQLPVLKMTLAPESVSLDQVRTLSDAGVLVSLGHTDATFETCLAYANAGATCATHLFNAMSQLGNREPGLVGAVLESGVLSAGLIADGVHVHTAVMRAAWAAKRGPGKIFLVSDAMAVAGTSLTQFDLDGRIVHRKNGRLTLENGTLAGADLDLLTAVRVLHQHAGVALSDALAAATHVPAALIGLRAGMYLDIGASLDQTIRIKKDLSAVVPLE